MAIGCGSLSHSCYSYGTIHVNYTNAISGASSSMIKAHSSNLCGIQRNFHQQLRVEMTFI